jgi:hypothetical protein
MEVKVLQEGQKLTWHFLLDETDGKYTEKIWMQNDSFSIVLPKEFDARLAHPDHLALISLLVAHPFVGTELKLPFEVSERFSDATNVFTSYKVIHSKKTGIEYHAPEDSSPGLAFSGGADSTACLLLMPESTVSVFMDRPIRKKTSMYNKTAAYATIAHARKQGHEMHSISCDVEYLRQPLGFPTDLVPSLPLLAIAQQRSINSIAFGTVMESAYRIGHEKARNYEKSHHYKLWGRLFRASGLPLFLPVAGISEVGTSKIVRESSFNAYTRSCIRGKWPNACENCWKCFRKNMVEEKFRDGRVSENYLVKGLAIKEVKLKVSQMPISHENVLSWALQGSQGHYSEVFIQRLEGENRDLSYLECYYPPSIDLMPVRYQEETKNRILSFLKPMKEQYFNTVTDHKMTPWLESTNAIQAKKKFDEFMIEKFPINS